jgi:hypothetical protein
LAVFLLPSTDLVNLVQVAALELLSQVGNAGLDLRGFWHTLQALTLFDQISILTGTLKPQVQLLTCGLNLRRAGALWWNFYWRYPSGLAALYTLKLLWGKQFTLGAWGSFGHARASISNGLALCVFV